MQYGVSDLQDIGIDPVLDRCQRIHITEEPLRIEIKGQKLSTPLSLPLINHFEEMRRGAIQTYIDPQLSQGIDSLRAQIIALCQTDAQEIQLLVMSQNGWESITAAQDDNCWVLI